MSPGMCKQLIRFRQPVVPVRASPRDRSALIRSSERGLLGISAGLLQVHFHPTERGPPTAFIDMVTYPLIFL